MKVVLVTVAGRRRFLELQKPYIRNLKGVVDEHHFWMNTKNEGDINYIKELCGSDPNYFKMIQGEGGLFDESGTPKNSHVGEMIAPFFQYCVDPDTVYIRIDDDVCFIETKAFAGYVQFRIDHPEYFLVYPIIVNNCMDFRIYPPEHDFCQSKYDDEKHWRPHGGQIGLHLHNVFFKHYPDLSGLKFEGVRGVGEMASVNCISWLGSEFAKFDGKVALEPDGYVKEEDWLIRTRPNRIGKKSCFYGGCVVCHYSYAHQRAPNHTYFGEGLDLDTTDVYERYKKLSKEQQLRFQ